MRLTLLLRASAGLHLGRQDCSCFVRSRRVQDRALAAAQDNALLPLPYTLFRTQVTNKSTVHQHSVHQSEAHLGIFENKFRTE